MNHKSSFSTAQVNCKLLSPAVWKITESDQLVRAMKSAYNSTVLGIGAKLPDESEVLFFLPNSEMPPLMAASPASEENRTIDVFGFVMVRLTRKGAKTFRRKAVRSARKFGAVMSRTRGASQIAMEMYGFIEPVLSEEQCRYEEAAIVWMSFKNSFMRFIEEKHAISFLEDLISQMSTFVQAEEFSRTDSLRLSFGSTEMNEHLREVRREMIPYHSMSLIRWSSWVEWAIHHIHTMTNFVGIKGLDANLNTASTLAGDIVRKGRNVFPDSKPNPWRFAGCDMLWDLKYSGERHNLTVGPKDVVEYDIYDEEPEIPRFNEIAARAQAIRLVRLCYSDNPPVDSDRRALAELIDLVHDLAKHDTLRSENRWNSLCAFYDHEVYHTSHPFKDQPRGHALAHLAEIDFRKDLVVREITLVGEDVVIMFKTPIQVEGFWHDGLEEFVYGKKTGLQPVKYSEEGMEKHGFGPFKGVRMAGEALYDMIINGNTRYSFDIVVVRNREGVPDNMVRHPNLLTSSFCNGSLGETKRPFLKELVEMIKYPNFDSAYHSSFIPGHRCDDIARYDSPFKFAEKVPSHERSEVLDALRIPKSRLSFTA